MRLDTSQQMKLGQHMKLAPRMIQSMEILQLALPALEERIEQELESNVALETFEPEGDEVNVREQIEETERDARENERELLVDENGSAEDFERLASFENSYGDALDDSIHPNAREREYEPGSYSPSRMEGERDSKMDAMANAPARGASLVDQLLEQWMFAEIDETLREPGKLVIENIDDDGYIRAELERVAQAAPPGSGGDNGQRASVEQLERALQAIQLFLEPPGIGARDVRECLLLQADAACDEFPGDDGWRHARLLIDEHFDDLLHNRLPRIAERSGLPMESINDAVERMRRLDLHPGRQVVSEAPSVIVPDAIVEYDEDADTYVASLTDGRFPRLRVNDEIAALSKDRSVERKDRAFIRTNIANAQWLIDAVGQRRQTMLRVINVVVGAQRDFFDLGPQALKPLPMTQVAEQLGVHVATVSRAVSGKFLQTPRGVFPLRQFFSGGTQTESGEEMSWEAVRAALHDIIDAEDKAKPLSDEALAKALKERGIDIARRTVAKYRAQMDIPPARMRKKF
ncbi:MAG: RNA polymerase factor sigma-54 [Planctomycetota bacterium]